MLTDEQKRLLVQESPLLKSIEQFMNSGSTDKSSSKPGPKTPEGKRNVRYNAMKHGFSGHAVLVPEHQKDDYIKHIKSLKAEYNPKGYSEEMMVTQLTNIAWQLEGMRSTGENLMSILGTMKPPFETGNAEQDFLAAQAANFEKQMKAIDKISLYESRKTRLFHQTLDKLRALQYERKLKEAKDLEKAAHLRQVAKSTTQAWNPAQDGFVFSLKEIDHHISLSNRLKQPPGGLKKAA